LPLDAASVEQTIRRGPTSADTPFVEVHRQVDFNVINVAGQAEYLIVETGAGAVHLALLVIPNSDQARSALLDRSMYLNVALTEEEWERMLRPMWARTTLCGRQWSMMASGETLCFGPRRLAPTCKACLRSIDARLKG
jgi:hypothetical protein